MHRRTQRTQHTGTAYRYHVSNSILPHASHLVEHSSLCCSKLVVRELPLLFELSQIFQLLRGGVWLRCSGGGGFRILLNSTCWDAAGFLRGEGQPNLVKTPQSHKMQRRMGTKQPPTTPPTMPPRLELASVLPEVWRRGVDGGGTICIGGGGDSGNGGGGGEEAMTTTVSLSVVA